MDNVHVLIPEWIGLLVQQFHATMRVVSCSARFCQWGHISILGKLLRLMKLYRLKLEATWLDCNKIESDLR